MSTISTIAHDPAAVTSQYGQYAFPQQGYVQSQPMAQQVIQQMPQHYIQQAVQGFMGQHTIAQPIVQYHAAEAPEDPNAKLDAKLANLAKLLSSATAGLVQDVTREIHVVKYKTKSQTVKIPVTGVAIQNGVQQLVVTHKDHVSTVPEHVEYEVNVTEPRQLVDGSWAHVTTKVKKTRPAFDKVASYTIKGVPPEADASEFGADENEAVSAEFLAKLKKVDGIPAELKDAESVVWGAKKSK
jgi:hypothetical protein